MAAQPPPLTSPMVSTPSPLWMRHAGTGLGAGGNGQTYFPQANSLARLPQVAQSTPANTHSSAHTHDEEPSKGMKAITNVAIAVGLFAVGRLLHKLPAYHPTFPEGQYKKWQRIIGEVLPLDWKDWARIFLGVGVVNSVNKAIDKEPPPWLNALQTVTVLTPMMGASVFSKATWKHFPLLAFGVPLLVQVTSWGQQQMLKKDSIPKWVPNTLLPLASTIGGMLGLRAFIAKSSGQVMGAEMTVCMRCGGMHLVCPAEIGEFFGAFLGGHQSKSNGSPPPSPAVRPMVHTPSLT